MQQSLEKHARYFPLQHFVWLPLGFVMLISTIGYTIYQLVKGQFSGQTILLLGVVVLAIIPGMIARIYAVKLQDRLIRTEEQLRYYMLTQKRLDRALSIQHLIALRFASDEEYVLLVDRAVDEKLTPADIKNAIQVWRADYYRV